MSVCAMEPLSLPEPFRQRVVSTWGEQGKAWLERLPALAAACARQWDLSIHSPTSDLSYNFTAFVATADGTGAVLKLGVPNPELTTEMAALHALAGRSVVRLLAADRQRDALLLQRVLPGTPLSALSDDEATAIASSLVRDIPVPVPPTSDTGPTFPTIAKWARAFDRLRTRSGGGTEPLPSRLVEKAERLFQELEASAPPAMLLHGDLHHDNVLRDANEGWLAVDPKGVLGDPAYEAARLQHNPIPGFLAMEHPKGVAQARLQILASVLEEDRQRLLAWAFFDAMLSACWSVEDGGDWRYHVSCAELLDTVLA